MLPHKVSDIISYVDNNSIYWPIKDIKDINKNGNTVERDVLTPPNNNKAHQFLTIKPGKSIIENQIEGPITGIKMITLITVDMNNDNNNRILR